MKQIPLTPIARQLHRRSLLACGSLLAPLGALANPTGADVVSGQVGISTPGAGGMVIDQTSNTAIINWQEFSIGDGEYVLFNQPSASAAVLNRVIGGLPSDILGDLTANGRVFLINPQGIMFGAGSRIDVGALVATTHDISDEDFLSGNYVFAGNSAAGVTNAGSIHTGDGGFVILTADHVSNGGTIETPNGDVVLAAGNQLSMQLDAEGLVSVSIDAAAVSDLAGVDNAGEIIASGGAVLLRADVARGLLANAVNNSGRISAQAIEERGGEIYLVASGGDVTNGGALDVSGQNGSDGGTVVLAGDRNVTLGSGSVIDASGASGGTVVAIADGLLDDQAGAHIDVSDTGAGNGGKVELSGHERIHIAGSVDLGSNGHLLIDPATMTIGDGPSVDMTTATLETLLQSNAQGSTVQIVATDSITIQDLGGDNTLNGVNTSDSTKGAGLKLETGTCGTAGAFGECTGTVTRSAVGSISILGANDTLDIAGDLSIVGGSSGGQVDVNAKLVSGGDVYIEGYDGVDVANDISAAGSLYVYAHNGIALGGTTTAGSSVSLYAAGTGTANFGIDANGPISAVGSAYIQTHAGTVSLQDVTVVGDETGLDNPDAGLDIDNYGSSGADITTGTLTATAGQGRASVYVYTGNGNVHVGGDIIASGGGFDDSYGYGGAFASYAYGGSLAAGVSLYAYNGTLDVDGDVDITGIAINSTSNYLGDSYSTSYGEASLYAYAGSINFDGAVTVKGNGGAYVDVYTGTLIGGGITFGSTLTVFADAAHNDVVYADGSEIHRQYGQAEAHLDAYGGTITTHGVDVSGPNAYFDAYASQVVMNGDEGGQALRVHAPQGAANDDLGSYFEYLDAESGESVATSTFGFAAAQISADGGGAEDPSIYADGDIDVSGPSAGLAMTAAYGVTIEGDLSVAGQGYVIGGDWTLIDYQHLPGTYGYGSEALSSGIYIIGDPLLSSGTSAWGTAALQILGFGQQYGGEVVVATTPIDGAPLAGEVVIGGNLSVSGQGRALAGISATGLDVGGDVTVHADAGLVAGTVHSYEYINDQYTEVIRQIGGALGTDPESGPTATGNAQYGEARFYFDSADSGTLLDVAGDLEVSGNSASIEIAHQGDAHFGGVQLLGGSGADAPRYVEVALYVPYSTSALAVSTPSITEVVGDANVLDIGFDAESRPTSLVIDGDVVVEGTGLVAAAIHGGTVAIGGTVSVQHAAGTYSTDNPEYAAPPPNFAAALIDIGATDGPAAIGGISANVDGTLVAGLDVDASGNVVLKADMLTQTLSGAYRDFTHPLAFEYPESGSPDITFEPLSIQANGITLTFSSDSELLDAALTANGTLAINGSGAALSAGVVDWSGGTINVNNTVVEAAQFALAGGGTVSNSTLDAGGGSMSFTGGQWTITGGSDLIGGAVSFTGVGGVVIQNSTVDSASFTAVAGNQIQVINSTLQGSSGVLQTTAAGGTGILVDHSTLAFSNPVEIDSASLFELRANTIDAADVDVQSVDLTLVADTDLTIVSRNLSYGVGTFSAGNTLTITDSALTGTSTTLSAPVANIGDSLIDSGSGALILSGAQWTIDNNTVLSAGSVAFDGAQTVLLQNTAIIAGSVDAVAANGIDVIASELEGQTLLLQTTSAAGDGILVDQSTLFFSDTIEIDSASTLTIDSSLIGDFPAALAAKAAGSAAMSLHAADALVIAASHLSGDDVVLEGASLTLGGIVDGNHVSLLSDGAIVAAAEGLEINAGALDAVGLSIDLTNSAITVGTGLADNGQDPAMLQQIADKAPALSPSSSGPNAAFVAEEGVLLGDLTIAGGYLFVQAPFVGADSITAPGDFFYNYRPFDDAAAIDLAPGGSFNVGGSTTFAFGGTGYTGDVEVIEAALLAKASEAANYIFLTDGELRGLDRISTSGQVVVLGGTVIRPPQEGSPQDEADGAIVLTQDLGDELTEEDKETYTGDAGDYSEYGDGARVDIVSGGTDDLICQ